MSASGRMVLRNDPHVDWEDLDVEFRLTYEGPLYAESHRDGEVRRARAQHKHEIRKRLHPQLRRWWAISPFLRPKDKLPRPGGVIFGYPAASHSVDALASRFARNDYNFVPLVTRDLELFCALEILLLREGKPGAVINSGDLDNRLKTLFDALCMPRDKGQLGSYLSPEDDEKPFFCLLEDDSVITKAIVETDTLLQSVSEPPTENDVRAVITVKIRAARVTAENIGFG